VWWRLIIGILIASIITWCAKYATLQKEQQSENSTLLHKKNYNYEKKHKHKHTGKRTHMDGLY
jgi:hypothetical protein